MCSALAAIYSSEDPDDPADAWVYPLTPTFHYNTPIADPLSATPCRCNTVLYSTIEACATCQSQGNYVTPFVSSLALGIPIDCVYQVVDLLPKLHLYNSWYQRVRSIVPLSMRQLTPLCRYPENIPPGTAVPAWAYLDVTVSCQLSLHI